MRNTSWSKDENQQLNQRTCHADCWNQSVVTSVGGEWTQRGSALFMVH